MDSEGLRSQRWDIDDENSRHGMIAFELLCSYGGWGGRV